MQLLLQRVKDFGAPADRFGKAVRPDRHDHEFLNIDRVVRVLAAIDDVHHRHGQDMRRNTADIAVEREAACIRRRLGNRHAGAEDRIRTDPALVRRTVERDHRQVDIPLVFGVECPDQHVADLGVHRIHGVDHALAQIPSLVAVAQFYRFMRPGRGTAWHSCTAETPVVEKDVDFDRGIASRIENFACVDVDDRGHGCWRSGQRCCKRLKHPQMGSPLRSMRRNIGAQVALQHGRRIRRTKS